MSRVARTCAALAVVASPITVGAQEAEPPTAEFLEYLGSWQDDDEEWFVEAEINEASETESDGKRKRVDNETE